MSLFDTLKEKAAELLGGAGDKVSELTGIDLPGGEIAGGLADAGQNLADTATEAVSDATDPGPRG
jgi:hypothetical protein